MCTDARTRAHARARTGGEEAGEAEVGDFDHVVRALAVQQDVLGLRVNSYIIICYNVLYIILLYIK